jgi:hypothetical protein
VVGLATVLTPNQFEAQLLSGVAIRSLADAGRACDVLHSRGPRVVLLTSCSVEEGGGAPGEGGKLRLIVSSAAAHAAGEGGESGGGGAAVAARRHQIEVPKLAHSFTGTGERSRHAAIVGHSHALACVSVCLIIGGCVHVCRRRRSHRGAVSGLECEGAGASSGG